MICGKSTLVQINTIDNIDIFYTYILLPNAIVPVKGFRCISYVKNCDYCSKVTYALALYANRCIDRSESAQVDTVHVEASALV